MVYTILKIIFIHLFTFLSNFKYWKMYLNKLNFNKIIQRTDKTKYEGNWQDDEMHGIGIFTDEKGV